MKLQDALKRIFREFGMNVLKEKRFVFLLSDYKAFDDYPAVKQIIKAIVDDGYSKELCCLGMDGSGEDCLNYAVRLRKSLSADRNFKPELAGFAVDCILFAMGLISSVREPSDHGFDPCGNGTPSPGQIGSATKSDGGAAPDDSMEILSGSWASTAGTADSTTVAEKIQRQSVTQTGSTSSLESSVTGPRAPAGQQNPNSAGSPDNQVPVQNSSGSSITPDKVYYSDKQYSLFSPVGWFTDKGRIGRAEFWCRLTIWSLLVFVFYRLYLEDYESYESRVSQSKFEGFCYHVSWIAIFGGYISILLRRCWDLDHRNGFAIFSPYGVCTGVALLSILGDSHNYTVTEIIFSVLFGILFLLWGGHYLIRILFFKGTDGPNKYGPDPTKKKLYAR